MKCQYCQKICKNSNSHRNHERCCPSNPNRNYKNGMTGKSAWNKGKTKETDSRVRKNGKSIKRVFAESGHKGFTKGSKHSVETRDRLSLKACNRLAKNSKYSKNIEYKGVILESTFEVRCAEILDRLHIKWEKVRRGFEWNDRGNKRRYIPDFYLPEYDVYLDPKNDYLIKKDKRKIKSAMEINSIEVIVVSEDNLNEDFLLSISRNYR